MFFIFADLHILKSKMSAGPPWDGFPALSLPLGPSDQEEVSQVLDLY